MENENTRILNDTVHYRPFQKVEKRCLKEEKLKILYNATPNSVGLQKDSIVEAYLPF